MRDLFRRDHPVQKHNRRLVEHHLHAGRRERCPRVVADVREVAALVPLSNAQRALVLWHADAATECIVELSIVCRARVLVLRWKLETSGGRG